MGTTSRISLKVFEINDLQAIMGHQSGALTGGTGVLDSSYLMQKGHTWYARLMVPKQYREQLGRTKYQVSLGTRDKAEANRRKHAVIADLQRRLEAEIQELSRGPQTARGMLARAEAERRLADSGESSQEDADISFDVAVDAFLEGEARRRGRDEDGHPLLSDEEVRIIRAAHQTVAGTGGLLLERAAELYLAEIAATVRNQTVREKQRGLVRFSNWLGGGRTVDSITRRLAGQYVTQVVAKSGRQPKTQRDEVGHLSAFFGWLERRGEIEGNPFHRVSGSIRGSTRGTAPKRRPWGAEELAGLLRGIPAGDPLWPMVAIAVYSGMRREEVVNLRVEDVSGDFWSVRAGKTRSAVRTIPIHPVIQPLVESLSERSDDGYLVTGLLTGGDDNKRGHLVGKRFGSLRRRLGYTDEGLNYHTLRNSFIHRCEEAKLPLPTVKQLVGHSRTDITYGVYSPGVSRDSLREAMESVSYGSLDDYVRLAGAEVAVTRRSRRRKPRVTPRAA